MPVTILSETIKNPLSFMGQCAGIAYDSDTTDPEKNYKRGKQCVLDGHYRMLEFCDVFMEIDGYSIRVMREFMRSVGDGLTVIQRSTRYCKESNSEIYEPKSIANDFTAHTIFTDTFNYIMSGYEQLLNLGISKEDASNLLPLGLHTKLAIKKNARNLSDMSAQRLCSRALKEYRDLMKDIINALSSYSEEWKELCKMVMKCKCDKVGWCEEEFSCGKYLKKQDVMVVPIGKDSNPNEFDS